MKKYALKFGAIAGILVVVFMFIGMALMKGDNGEMNFDLGETLGYTTMILSLSLIFFGVKAYRDDMLGGTISFGEAFKTGILITLVASLIYVIGWMVYYHTSPEASQFMDQYIAHSVKKMEAKGMSQTEINQFVEETRSFAKMYHENPFVMAGITLMEIFPVGLIITLLSSFFLKRTSNA